MNMKYLLSAFAVALTLSGCCLLPSPYDRKENWLICEEATRAFAVPADVFYMQGGLYMNESSVSLMYSYARTEVGGMKFNGLARVFSPLVASEEDFERALSWYFWHAHERKRPFVFIGEGEGGRFLRAYEDKHAKELKKKGLVASFYTETSHKGFVSSEMVDKIKAAVLKRQYKSVWGRDMPRGN